MRFDHYNDSKMTPFDDFVYLINSILLGEEPVRPQNLIHLIFPLILYLIFVLDRRRLHTTGRYVCCVCGIHTLVLLSNCSKRDGHSTVLWRSLHSISKNWQYRLWLTIILANTQYWNQSNLLQSWFTFLLPNFVSKWNRNHFTILVIFLCLSVWYLTV